MRRIGQWYRETSLVGRIITAGFILAILTAASFNFHWDIIPVVVGGLVTMFLVEVVFTRPNLISATIFTLFHAMFVTVYVYNIIKTMTAYKNENELFLIEAMTYAGAFVSAVVILAGSWYIANGRFWFNVLISYVLYAAAVISLLYFGVNPLYITFIAILLPAIWITLRGYVLYRRFKPDTLDVIPRRKADNAAQRRLEKELNVTESFTTDGINVLNTGEHIYLVYTLTPDRTIEFTPKGVFMDDLDVSMIMENLTNKAAYLSKTTKVNHKKLIPVVYVTNNKLDRGITPVNFRNRQKPDVSAGTVFFSTSKNFKRLQQQVKNKLKPLTEEEATRFALYRVEH